VSKPFRDFLSPEDRERIARYMKPVGGGKFVGYEADAVKVDLHPWPTRFCLDCRAPAMKCAHRNRLTPTGMTLEEWDARAGGEFASSPPDGAAIPAVEAGCGLDPAVPSESSPLEEWDARAGGEFASSPPDGAAIPAVEAGCGLDPAVPSESSPPSSEFHAYVAGGGTKVLGDAGVGMVLLEGERPILEVSHPLGARSQYHADLIAIARGLRVVFEVNGSRVHRTTIHTRSSCRGRRSRNWSGRRPTMRSRGPSVGTRKRTDE
jgi:hypothetical protein